jgi:rsbT co-antagonist protein RsbR
LDLDTLRHMLERLPGAVFCARQDAGAQQLRWVYLHPRTAELWGVSEAELQLDPSAGRRNLDPQDEARLNAAMAESAQTGTPASLEVRIRRLDGDIRRVEMHLAVERTNDGARLWYGQILDVTERHRTAQQLAESEIARSRADEMHRQIIEALPVGVVGVTQAAEVVVINATHRRWIGGAVDATPEVSEAYGVFMADGVTPLPTKDTGLMRALRGEAKEEEVVIRNPRIPEPVRLLISWTPLRDEHGQVYLALGAAQDITLQHTLEEDLRARNEALQESEAEKAALIDRLRYAIDELSNPILEVWDDVLVMPIIGVVDSRRAADMVNRLLAEVERTQVGFVIIDLTGVDVVDTQTAHHLMQMVHMVEMIGARCVLTGLRGVVARTLVDIGVDFGKLTTLRNLKHGLREALRSRAEPGASPARGPAQ